MSPWIIIGLKALAIVAAIGALLWGIHSLDQSRQQIGYDRRVSEGNAELIKAQAATLATERALNQKLEVARNEAKKREQAISRNASAAGLAVEQLRHELDPYRDRPPGDPAGPGDQRAATLAELFADCAERYRGVAEKADRHASDARTLSEGWPK